MLNEKVFKIENGRALVDHAILKDVAYEKDHKDRLSKNFPVEAYEIYDQVGEIVSVKSGAKIKYDKLIVPEKAIKLFGRTKGVHALENHKLNQHVGSLNIVTKSDTDMALGVAIACNERGIRIAFGTRIFVCANQCIFGDKVMSTFGNNSMPYDKILEVLKEYMNRFDLIHESETKIISQMNEIVLDQKEIQRLIGDIYITSRVNLMHQNNAAALNITDIGKIMDSLIILSNENDKNILEEDTDTTLWDFYNTTTRVLNPLTHNDPVNVLEPNAGLMNYLMSKYGLEAPILN